MAESMFSNVYDARQKDLEGAVDYGASLAALPRGRVSVAVAGQSGGMLGQGLSSLAGALPPEQAQQAKMDELMSRFPNPTTYEDYMAIAGEFMTSGMQDMGEYFLKLANDISGTSDQKKWDFEQRGKRDAIDREAKSRGYILSEEDINDIAIRTPLRAKLNEQTGQMIEPWMDILESTLSRRTPVSKPTEAPTPTSVSTDVKVAADTKALQTMSTAFNTEVKPYKENLNTVESGLNIVNQVRSGNIAALPQLEKMLAKFNSDNKISVPEVKQVMKIGGLGDRITDTITRFLSGDLSPGTLNDIEEMLTRVGQLDQGKYNAKISEYKLKYGDRHNKEALDKWLIPNTSKFYTEAQKKELVMQEIKKRGLK